MFHAGYIKRFFVIIAIVLLWQTQVFARPVFVDITLVNPEQPIDIKYISSENTEKALEASASLTVVHFWATWCAPCVEELPEVAKLALAYNKQGVKVLALTEQAKDVEEIRAFYAEHKIDLPIALDPRMRAAHAAGVKGVPASLFLNKKGAMIARADGQVDWGSEKTKAFLQQYLKK